MGIRSAAPVAGWPPPLLSVLARARQLGYLGPGPIDRHLAHAAGFWEAMRPAAEEGAPVLRPATSGDRILDLGSGGGLPGLVLAFRVPQARLVLLDANERRAGFLSGAVRRCSLESRVEVVHERAEICGRDPRHRGAYDAVVSRSFGPPAVTAECAAGFLRIGGILVTSEPPPPAPATAGDGVRRGVSGARWPAEGLELLGMTPAPTFRSDFTYQVVRQASACPDRFPRRIGVPAKRPLF
ncbi:MAG: RsmG family class I SAM-dependent methyltransferase [Acidimicrobiales bacterium]